MIDRPRLQRLAGRIAEQDEKNIGTCAECNESVRFVWNFTKEPVTKTCKNTRCGHVVVIKKGGAV